MRTAIGGALLAVLVGCGAGTGPGTAPKLSTLKAVASDGLGDIGTLG